jgi:hypothetical protein
MTQSTSKTKGAEFTEFPDYEDESESVNSNPVLTFEQKVNAATQAMTQKEDGTWEVPDGLSEEVAYAAKLEKRRRDTQSEYTKTAQQNKELKELARKNVQLSLTVEQREELADLKESNPDAWRDKLGQYEQEAVAAVESDLKAVDEAGDVHAEETRRVELLRDCLANNPGLVLNDEVFENDLPPRITKALVDGKISFDTFLEQAVAFLKPATKIKGADDKDEEEPNLSKVGGKSTAEPTAVDKDAEKSYVNEIY